jgi:pheganomycin biosynthesis PGM1-like protein
MPIARPASHRHNGSPLLADLSEAQRSERFAELQLRLPSVWAASRSGREGESIVVVPSRTVDKWDEPAAEAKAYEERLLFLLLLLRQPQLRVIYVTSLPIDPSIVDYYLGLLAGVIPAHARARLSLVAAGDGSPRPLSAKLLERPRLIERIRGLIPDLELCHLVPYNTTALERDVALLLGIPMYGADPRFFHFGTKTGCRQLFAEEGVAHPFGENGLDSLEGVIGGLARLRATRPGVREALVKLNEGVSGEGNALVDLRDLPPAGSPDEARALERQVRAMSYEAEGLDFDMYAARLGEHGGVVEERISGTEFRSPSVQLRIVPSGELEVLSTHDQLLGGPSGQSYVGCRFPADPAYARLITVEAEKVGVRLAREGVVGRFAIDFVVVREENGPWEPYAIEINLRKGGTTHPYLTLEFLTDGRYDPVSATFRAPGGGMKFLVATDHLESELLKGLTHGDLFDVIVREDLHYDYARQSGVVFHMMSALTELGRVGLTGVADTPGEAEEVYRRAEAILLDDGRAALEPCPLPPLARPVKSAA